MFGEIDLYLAETEYHIILPRAVVLQELVAHPTKLHTGSRCPQALFIIGALLEYIVSILLLLSCRGSMQKEGSLKRNREDQGERANQPDERIIHTYGQENTAAKGAAVR